MRTLNITESTTAKNVFTANADGVPVVMVNVSFALAADTAAFLEVKNAGGKVIPAAEREEMHKRAAAALLNPALLTSVASIDTYAKAAEVKCKDGKAIDNMRNAAILSACSPAAEEAAAEFHRAYSDRAEATRRARMSALLDGLTAEERAELAKLMA